MFWHSIIQRVLKMMSIYEILSCVFKGGIIFWLTKFFFYVNYKFKIFDLQVLIIYPKIFVYNY